MSEQANQIFTNKEDMNLKVSPYHSRMQTIYIMNNSYIPPKSYYDVPSSNSRGVILSTRVEREKETYVEFRQVELKTGKYIKIINDYQENK